MSMQPGKEGKLQDIKKILFSFLGFWYPGLVAYSVLLLKEFVDILEELR